jgi:hypothetical protein
VAVATLAVALGAGAWLNLDLLEGHRVGDAFMAGLASSGASAGRTPATCPGSDVVPEAVRRGAVGEVDWDFGFRSVQKRDGRERLSRQGFLSDARTGEERWFKLTMQREGAGGWCVLALSVDASARKFR